MEKTLSVEERIRRAEEIYNRRTARNENVAYTYNRPNKKINKKNKLMKKMFLQIILCFVIYAVFYTISNNKYIFSEDFRKNVDSILNTEMNFYKIYSDIQNYFSLLLSTNVLENVDNSSENQTLDPQNDDIKDTEEIEVESNNLDLKNSTIEEIENTSVIESENIGGAVEGMENTLEESKEVEEEKSQMEIDAQDIKSRFSFEVPVDGYISSTFGLRNPTTQTVPKNHTGLDIAAKSGTVIRSATDGVVTLVSSYGDYGKHYKIEIEDVTIIYAHCSKLYLKEGDQVTKGQSIAEVGSTGNSTGPHLHFEIRKEGRLVDPQLILDI